MQATILQVSISLGGLPKYAVPQAYIAPLGLEGDRHAHPQIHGGPQKAVLLVSAENLEALAALGFPLAPGALGENLTTRGLDFRQLRIGDRVRAGGALLEIAKPRGPCSQLDIYGPGLAREIYDSRVSAGDYTSPRWGMSGLYAAVLAPGPVAAGDIIALEAALA